MGIRDLLFGRLEGRRRAKFEIENLSGAGLGWSFEKVYNKEAIERHTEKMGHMISPPYTEYFFGYINRWREEGRKDVEAGRYRSNYRNFEYDYGWKLRLLELRNCGFVNPALDREYENFNNRPADYYSRGAGLPFDTL
ncbi:MAG: hypothetical protein FWD68_16640 [Alphaproteobacteria bacterium]|nr:hypothetical protein [Alphaproteobacteria bacterium]